MTTITTASVTEAALFEKLRLQGMKVKPKDAWMKSFGRAREDKHFESAMRLGAEWRDEENRRSLEELNHPNADS
ncbi:MAG: hypothetical protein Q8M07_31235 [Prosthecobacter sp.]|nr:hypothetical protein [Prosthecobacter sp.]